MRYVSICVLPNCAGRLTPRPGPCPYGYQGVYNFGPDFHLMRYPIDYSDVGSLYMALEGNYGYPLSEFTGPPEELGAVELDATGGVILATQGSDPGRNNNVLWWQSDFPLLSNALTLSSLYGIVISRDVEASLGSHGPLWHFYGVEEDFGYAGNELGIVMAGVGWAYEPSDYISGWGINRAPVDYVGSVDCEVSDLESYRMAVDTNPRQLTDDLDIITYFLEGPPGDPGIEVFANQVSSHGEAQTYLATIDTALVGVPVDISVLNNFGNIPYTDTNWLCVLEDNGDNTWQVALFDQNGSLIDRLEHPIHGTPIGLDCDTAHQTVHV